ncbi:hypothetical protein ACIBQX_00540 [Nonomuraea sp. NPDC049714]
MNNNDNTDTSKKSMIRRLYEAAMVSAARAIAGAVGSAIVAGIIWWFQNR